MSDSRDRIAQLLAGNPGVYDSQGLESPPEQQILQNLGHVAGGYGMANLAAPIAKALVNQGVPALQGLGEAGAIFPESLSMSIPKDRAALKELGSILPESQIKYLQNQATSDWHASNYDWPRVLEDKWRLLTHAGGN